MWINILLFLIFPILASSQTTVNSDSVLTSKWVCEGQSSQNSNLAIPGNSLVEVRIARTGSSLIFVPDFLQTGNANQPMRNRSQLYSTCLNNFMSTLAADYQRFRGISCPATSTSRSCLLTQDSFDNEIFEKIDTSFFTSANRNDIRIIPLPKRAAAAELATLLTNGQIDFTRDLESTFPFEGQNQSVFDYPAVVLNHIDKSMVGTLAEKEKIITDFAYQHSEYLQGYRQCSPSPECTISNNKRGLVLSALDQMVRTTYGLDAEARFEALCDIPVSMPTEDLAGILQRTISAANCQSLTPGQHRRVPATGFTRSHLLKRDSEGNYFAAFNINFVYNNGSMTASEMKKSVDNCLKAVRPFMKGPDGESLSLIALSPDKAQLLPEDERPEVTNISVEALGFRSHSGAYRQQVDCSTIVHEMLHNLGLGDEYPESLINDGQGSTCRVIPTTPSIMKTHTEAFALAVPKETRCTCNDACQRRYNGTDSEVRKLFLAGNSDNTVRDFCGPGETVPLPVNDPDRGKRIASFTDNAGGSFSYIGRIPTPGPTNEYVSFGYRYTCVCPLGNTECEAARTELRRISIEGAPMATTCNFNMGAEIRADDASTSIPGPDARSGLSGGVFTIVSQPKIKSILRANHFKKAISMGCTQLSSDYDECNNLSNFNLGVPQCNQEVRNRCLNDDHFLGGAY